jgi:tetratricopeptide (TPR) repeat protein
MAKKKKFYKKAKPKEIPQKLPSNSRSIPEKLMSDHLVFIVGFVCISLAILIVGLNLYNNYQKYEALSGEKARIKSEIAFWNSEVEKKPGFRDGYFSLALLHYQLKDFNKSEEFLNYAMEIDPNFEKGKELEVILENN